MCILRANLRRQPSSKPVAMTASHAPVDTTPRPESRGRDRPWAALGSALAAARPPRPLAVLLALTLLLGVTWSLVTPAFQAPDENSHFGYVQQLAERFELPGRVDEPLFSTEQQVAASDSNSDGRRAVQHPKTAHDADDRACQRL